MNAAMDGKRDGWSESGREWASEKQRTHQDEYALCARVCGKFIILLWIKAYGFTVRDRRFYVYTHFIVVHASLILIHIFYEMNIHIILKLGSLRANGKRTIPYDYSTNF